MIHQIIQEIQIHTKNTFSKTKWTLKHLLFLSFFLSDKQQFMAVCFNPKHGPPTPIVINLSPVPAFSFPLYNLVGSFYISSKSILVWFLNIFRFLLGLEVSQYLVRIKSVSFGKFVGGDTILLPVLIQFNCFIKIYIMDVYILQEYMMQRRIEKKGLKRSTAGTLSQSSTRMKDEDRIVHQSQSPQPFVYENHESVVSKFGDNNVVYTCLSA